MTLVGESKCLQAKQGTLRFTNIHHTFPSVITISHDKTNLPAAPLSTFALPLTLSCSQTQWLHVKVRGSASEDSGAEKSALNAITNFCTLPTAATALPRMRRNCLLQRPPPSRPYYNVYWDGRLSFVAAVEAEATKLIPLRQSKDTGNGKSEFSIKCYVVFSVVMPSKLTSPVI